MRAAHYARLKYLHRNLLFVEAKGDEAKGDAQAKGDAHEIMLNSVGAQDYELYGLSLRSSLIGKMSCA
jgi:hypothetical protein